MLFFAIDYVLRWNKALLVSFTSGEKLGPLLGSITTTKVKFSEHRGNAMPTLCAILNVC